MKDKKARKTEPPLHLDMEFGEALIRFAQTNPEEVEPPKGRKKKRPKLKMLEPRLKTLAPRTPALKARRSRASRSVDS
jgi:hypothetical protein